MTTLNKIAKIILALAILFVMGSSILMSNFSSSYRYAQETCWTNTTANCNYDTTVNTTAIANTSVNVCSAGEYSSSPNSSDAPHNMCQAVKVQGGYRTATQGLWLLALAIGVLAITYEIFKKH